MALTEEPTDDLRATLSIMGAMRFDATAVAKALRSRPLSPLEAMGLANLIEGKHPMGLTLKMQGQGKGWRPWSEGAAAWNRLCAVGKYVDSRLIDNCTVEEAVNDAAEFFGVSEPTIYRDLRLYRRSVSDDL